MCSRFGGPWLDATRICRGDQWSPASGERNFYFLFVALLPGRDGRPMVAPTGMVFISLILIVLRSYGLCSRFEGPWLDATRICRGDQWSPAFRNRNFRFAFVVLLTEGNGRPMVAPTGVERPGANGRSGEQPGTGAGRSGGKQVEGGATGAGDQWSPLREQSVQERTGEAGSNGDGSRVFMGRRAGGKKAGRSSK